MAYKFSSGKRGFGDITFEDDADTGIDFEADTIKLETGGVERLVVTNAGIGIREGSSPGHTADFGKLYVKSSDHNLYFKNQTGTETNLLAAQDCWLADNSPADSLHASSYKRGDGVSGWSYATDETGVLQEDAFGLHTGTMAKRFAWKAPPDGEFSITTHVVLEAPNIQYRDGGLVLGKDIGDEGVTAFTGYFWKIEIDGSNAMNLVCQHYDDNSWQGNEVYMASFGYYTSVYLRIGVNADHDEINVYASHDGIGWFHGGTVSLEEDINQVGLHVGWPSQTKARFGWYRIRTGAGEFDNSDPEGSLTS